MRVNHMDIILKHHSDTSEYLKQRRQCKWWRGSVTHEKGRVGDGCGCCHCHCCCCLVAKSCPSLSDPMDCSPPGFFCPWDFFSTDNGVGCHFFLQGIFLLGLEPKSPALQADSLPLSHHRAKSLQSSPTLCDPMDRSLPGSYVHGIL